MGVVDPTDTWRGTGSATLKDIARLVGVSESAASVVLNGSRSHTRVSLKTRERVTRAAEQLGYRPNAVARALSLGRTNRIGVYASRLGDAGDPFWSDIHVGLYRQARAFDVDVVIHTSGGESNRLLELVSDRTVDGLIVVAQGDSEIIQLLEERHVPAVALVDRIDGLPSVCVDDRAGAAMLAQHLFDRGHRHVLALESPLWKSITIVERLESFLETAESLGMRVSLEEFAVDSISPLSSDALDLLTCDRNRGTAVVAHNDLVADRVSNQLFLRDIAVPESIAVVGFDGHQSYFVPRLPLTSICADWPTVAATGVNVLMSLIAGEPVNRLTKLSVTFKQGLTT